MKELSKGILAAIIAGVLVVCAIFAIGFMAVFGYGWFTDATANRQGETQKKHQVEGNGQYRIGAYDHFYDLCASVQTAEARINNTQTELTSTTDSARKAQLQANLDAQRNTRSEAINQYNVDARKSYTLAQFKASNLPGHLDPTEKETSCVA